MTLFIVGGPLHALGGLEVEAVQRGAHATRLSVDVAAHTPLLDTAVERFRATLEASPLRAPARPVIAGIDASWVTTRERAIVVLSAQIAQTIEWTRCLDSLYERGCRVFIELGPGRAMSALLRDRFDDVLGRRRLLNRHLCEKALEALGSREPQSTHEIASAFGWPNSFDGCVGRAGHGSAAVAALVTAQALQRPGRSSYPNLYYRKRTPTCFSLDRARPASSAAARRLPATASSNEPRVFLPVRNKRRARSPHSNGARSRALANSCTSFASLQGRTMQRRHFLVASTAQLALLAHPFVAHAQAFPARPVRVVVAWPAGGFVDVVTRALTERLAESWSQPVLVENRTGAYGLVGTEQAMRSPADGHAWLVGTLGTPMSASLYRRKWSAADEFSGVAMIASAPLIAVVPASLPVNSVKEFIALARSQPGKLNYLNPSLGSASHLNTELLKLKEKIDIVSVAYNGQPPGVVDLLAGQTHFGLLAPQVAAGHIKTGKFKPLAVAFPTRLKEFPDVPTFAEAGHPELNVVASYSVLVPKGTPRDVVNHISADIQKALAHPEVRRRIEAAGAAVAGPSSPEQVDAFLKAETARWGAFFRDNKVNIDDATLR